MYQHGTIDDLIRRSLDTASMPSVLEASGMARDDAKGQDGVTLVPWKGSGVRRNMRCHIFYEKKPMPVIINQLFSSYI